MADPRRPVQLMLFPGTGAPTAVPLLDWLHRRPELRTAVRDAGARRDGRAGLSDAVIIAVVAHSLLPGLFALVQTWIVQQRSQTTVRVRVADSEVEVQVDGRTDPHRLVAELTAGLRSADPREVGTGDGQPPDAESPTAGDATR